MDNYLLYCWLRTKHLKTLNKFNCFAWELDFVFILSNDKSSYDQWCRWAGTVRNAVPVLVI